MEEKQRLLQENYPFWEHLTEAQEERLTKGCQEAVYQKGELVHRSEDQCKGAILLLDGQLRVYIVSEEGREVTLFRIREGETCVLSASCLLDAIAFDLMIEAVEDSRALVIPTPVLRPVMEENPYVGLYMYQSATERFSDVMWTMQQILFEKMDRRLGTFLADECAHTGKSEIRMTQEEIAVQISSAREVVTRMLKRFAADGFIELKRGAIIVKDCMALKNL